MLDDFLRSVDRYGNPVTLKYKGKGAYPTRGGGIATIFTTLVITYWLTQHILEAILYSERNFTIKKLVS